MIVYDEYASYHYKDLTEMIASPEYQRLIKLIRQGIEDGTITIYPSLPEGDVDDTAG